MNMQELKKAYKAGSLSKKEYIAKMYEHHKRLWEYHPLMAGNNIDSITITGEDVRVTTKDDVTMICNPGDERITPIEILNFGDYEPAETAMMKRLIAPDSVVLDIGANTGWYCIVLGRKATKGKVVAFEPIPELFGYLKKNLAINNIKNVELCNYGLSEKEQTLEFYFNPALSGATSMQDITEAGKKVQAKVKRMDDCVHLERVDFIKCDVEGGELLVLKGGMKTIERTKPILFLEMLRKWSAKFGYHPNDIIALLAPLGYSCHAIRDEKLVKVLEVTEETVETNFIFLHSEKHKRLLEGLR